MKTGECKYGARCKFNHPKERQATGHKEDGAPGIPNGTSAASDAVASTTGANAGSVSAGPLSGTYSVSVKVTGERFPGKAAILNSKGLPLRPVTSFDFRECQQLPLHNREHDLGKRSFTLESLIYNTGHKFS
jgi:hypothetical protein